MDLRLIALKRALSAAMTLGRLVPKKGVEYGLPKEPVSPELSARERLQWTLDRGELIADCDIAVGDGLSYVSDEGDRGLAKRCLRRLVRGVVKSADASFPTSSAGVLRVRSACETLVEILGRTIGAAKNDPAKPPTPKGFTDTVHADLWQAAIAQGGRPFKRGALIAKLPKGINYSETHIKNWLRAMCPRHLRHVGQTYCPILPDSAQS